jgi:predicted  nucleic acid-binding Zn-ribbon protein
MPLTEVAKELRMGKMKDLKIEIEEGVYQLQTLESELTSIKSELEFLENRKRTVEEAIKDLRAKFKFYRIFFQGERNN